MAREQLAFEAVAVEDQGTAALGYRSDNLIVLKTPGEERENMGIRVQPTDIQIPKQNPLENDLLGRKEPVEVLTNLLRSIDGPCVLAVDGAWGAGKTTFLRILSQYLRNRDFGVIEFSAWETDFADDPFLALSQELNEGLRACATGSLQRKLDEVKEATKEVLRRALPGTIRVLTAGILDVSPLMEKEAGQALASYAQGRFDNYLEARKSLQAFKVSLGQVATELATTNNDLPLVVVIDELDRCRPSYAVELLETAKHLFTVDHVVFVLALNRAELAHSVRAVYGAGFDAQGYLRRFIDIDFRLPEPKRRPFIEASLEATGIHDYFQKKSEHDNYETVSDWLTVFFEAFGIGLRSIAQAIHHLGLVFASLRNDRRSLAVAATLALILRTLDRDRYRRFTRGALEDHEIVKFLLDREPAPIEANRHYLEAVIIAAAMEAGNPERQHGPTKRSPLLKGYQETAEKTPADGGNDSEKVEYARNVVRTVGQFMLHQSQGSGGLGFNEAVRRLDLISPSLIDNDAS